MCVSKQLTIILIDRGDPRIEEVKEYKSLFCGKSIFILCVQVVAKPNVSYQQTVIA